jgi:hypothetical protein
LKYLFITGSVLLAVVLAVGCRKQCQELEPDTIQWVVFQRPAQVVYINQAGDSLEFQQVHYSEFVDDNLDTTQTDQCHAKASNILADFRYESICSLFIDKFRNSTRLMAEIYLFKYNFYGLFSISMNDIHEITEPVEINGTTYTEAILIENPFSEPIQLKNCIVVKGHGVMQFQAVSTGDVWTLTE